jgi:hypothetical protein
MHDGNRAPKNARPMVRKNVIRALSSALLVLLSGDAHAGADLRIEGAHLLVAMEGDAHHVAVLLRNARATHATSSAKCVDGYLSQIDASVRHGRDDLATIRSATSVGDDATAHRALGALSSRREAARSSAFAADACASPVVATPQDHTVVRVIVDPKVAGVPVSP